MTRNKSVSYLCGLIDEMLLANLLQILGWLKFDAQLHWLIWLGAKVLINYRKWTHAQKYICTLQSKTLHIVKKNGML